MRECDDCGEYAKRRRRCWHCGFFVCIYCWHHIHCCEPGHTKAECESLRLLAMVKPLGPVAVRDYLNRLRYLAQAKIERDADAAAAEASRRRTGLELGICPCPSSRVSSGERLSARNEKES